MKSTAAYSTVDSQMSALVPDFQEFQDRLRRALQDGVVCWHRISVRAENGKVTVVQQTHETNRDMRRLFGEGG